MTHNAQTPSHPHHHPPPPFLANEMPSHRKQAKPLVAVIGAGVVGLTTALLMQSNNYGERIATFFSFSVKSAFSMPNKDNSQ